MAVEDCVFCKMVAGEIPVAKLYEDPFVLAFLDIGPVSDGHALVIPKEHFTKLHECSAEVLGKIGPVVGKVAAAVVAAMDYDCYNVLCNNGRIAGQAVEHMHFHVIGRKGGDGLFDRWPAYRYQQGRIEELAAKIRDKI